MKIQFITSIAVLMMVSAALAAPAIGEENAVELNWLTDLTEAQQLATENGKPILVNFTGSDWCKWCITLDKEVFSQQEFIDYATENLIMVKLDFPRRTAQPQEVKDRNQHYASQYKIRGFPTIMLLEENGDVIAQTGYQRGGATAYVSHLESLLP
jgi:protein disulfide-isomerase